MYLFFLLYKCGLILVVPNIDAACAKKLEPNKLKNTKFRPN